MAGKGKSKAQGQELAVGYVSLTVDASRVGKEIEEELESAGTKGGKKAGQEIEEELTKAGKNSGQEIEEELGKAGTKGGKKAGENAGKEIKERLSGAVATAGVAAGAVVGAGIAVGLSSAMERADLPGTIQAKLDTTPYYAKEIAKAAGNAFNAGWGESVGDLAKTASVVAEHVNIFGDGSDIEDLTVKATALADTYEQDATAIANSAAQLVRTGLAGSYTEAFDVITLGFQSSSKLSEDFLESIDEYGVQFEALGLNGAEGIEIMNQALRGGARNGDLVSDALKEFVLITKEMGKPAAEAFKNIGLDAGKMQKAISAGGPEAKAAFGEITKALGSVKDPVLRNAAAVAIFGTKAEDLQGALFNIDPVAATQGLGDLAGRADEFVTNSMGMEQQLTSIHRTLTDGLGAALVPLLPQLQELATGGLVFFRWLGDNPIVTQILLGIAGAIAAAAAAQWVWNAAQMANPTTWIIFAVIAGIALLIAAIWLIASNWDTVWKGMSWLGATVWNGVIHGANLFIRCLNEVARAVEGMLSLGGLLGDWNWGTIGEIGLLDVPGLAEGGTVTRAGTTLVGERGPELLNLPRGSSVIPLDHPAAYSGAGKGGPSISITTVNPVSEPTSRTLQRASQLTGAALGV
jgi:phage-related minor tail protein